jgi:hypothetical protein
MKTKTPQCRTLSESRVRTESRGVNTAPHQRSGIDNGRGRCACMTRFARAPFSSASSKCQGTHGGPSVLARSPYTLARTPLCRGHELAVAVRTRIGSQRAPVDILLRHQSQRAVGAQGGQADSGGKKEEESSWQDSRPPLRLPREFRCRLGSKRIGSPRIGTTV